MADRISFRQVGKDRPGKLYRGVIMDAYNRITQASIPSKFELVLAKQEEPKEGFGHRAERFSESLVEEIPGPGQYQGGDSQSTSPSFSKKGFLGGFVSTKKRFDTHKYSTIAPGPGAYSPIHMRKLSNPAPVFTEKRTQYKKEPEKRPAPGTYDPIVSEKVKTLTTTFKRMDSVSTSEAPGPWHYDPNYSFIHSSSQKLTSAFKLPTHARRFQVNLYDPHAKVAEEAAPGPGYYSLSSSMDRGSLNASFERSGLDRFGRPMKVKVSQFSVPGPGTYNLHPKDLEKSPVNSSAFMSESDRDPLKIVRNPGPAFYRPIIIAKKKSFHLNAERKWV